MRVGLVVGPPLPWRIGCREDASVRDDVLGPMISPGAKQLGQRVGVDAMRGVMADVDRRDDAGSIRVVVGRARRVSGIPEEAIARLVALRGERIDLIAELDQALCWPPGGHRQVTRAALTIARALGLSAETTVGLGFAAAAARPSGDALVMTASTVGMASTTAMAWLRL